MKTITSIIKPPLFEFLVVQVDISIIFVQNAALGTLVLLWFLIYSNICSQRGKQRLKHSDNLYGYENVAATWLFTDTRNIKVAEMQRSPAFSVN